MPDDQSTDERSSYEMEARASRALDEIIASCPSPENPDWIIGWRPRAEDAAVTMASIRALAPPQQTALLSRPGALAVLALHGQGMEALDVIRGLNSTQQTAVFSGRDALTDFLQSGAPVSNPEGLVDNRAALATVDILKRLGGHQLATLLVPQGRRRDPYTPQAAAPIEALTEKGLVAEASDLVRKLTPDQQAAILASPGYFWGLRRDENIMGKLTAEQQTAVFLSPGAMWECAEDERGAAQTMAMIRKLNPDQRKSILEVPQNREALIKAGQGAAVEELDHGNKPAAEPRRPAYQVAGMRPRPVTAHL